MADKQVDKIKFLGVIIDDQLSWNDQIKYVENKLMSTIVFIKRIKKFIPSSHYFIIYHSLFISHMGYHAGEEFATLTHSKTMCENSLW